MSNTVLILDVSYLAHRSMHAMGGLSHDGSETSIVFGLMRDLVGWRELFRTDKVAFCFDWGRNKRLGIDLEYKANRRSREYTGEEQDQWAKLREQLRRLAEEDLFSLGYRNVFFEEGFEADDLIASVALSSLGEFDEGVIVASDADLYQLITPRVMMFDPRGGKQKTYQWFCKTFAIEPFRWADVKAIAGCSGDNVKGVKGVGEKTAIAYLRGDLKKGKKLTDVEANFDLWKRNLALVQLPFRGTPTFELREDRVTRKRWERFCERYGIRSLRELYLGR